MNRTPRITAGSNALPFNCRHRFSAARSQQRLEDVGEVAGADAFVVQPRNPLVDRLGPPQVRRQDRAGEPHSIAVRIHSLVVHPRPGDLDRPRACQDRPGRRVPIANHQPLAVGMPRVGVDILGHLVLDRRCQHLPGSLAEDLGQHVAGNLSGRVHCEYGVGCSSLSDVAYPSPRWNRVL